MRITYKRAFAQFVKKASKPFQLAIEDVVLEVLSNPQIGRQKLGDLKGVFVYKFSFNQQEYLVAYQLELNNENVKVIWIEFCQIGPHENFYTQLKRSIRLK